MKENYTEKRMVNRKDNYRYFTIENILCVFIIICPILDIASFLFRQYFNTNISISTFIRPIIPIIAVIYIFFKDKIKIPLIFVSFIYLAYALGHIYTFNIVKNGCAYGTMLNEIQYLVNYTFMIMNLFIYIYVFEYKSEGKNLSISKLKKSVLTSLTIYIITMYLTLITNTSSFTYAEEKIGYKGWFESGNSIGTIMVLSLFIVVPTIRTERKKIIKAWKIIVVLLVGIYLCALLGTRTGMFGYIIVMISYLILVVMYKLIKNKKLNKKNIILCVICFVNIAILVITIGSETLERRKQLNERRQEIQDDMTSKTAHVTGDIVKIVKKIKNNEMDSKYMSREMQDAYLKLYNIANEKQISNTDRRRLQIIYHSYLIKEQKNILTIMLGNGYMSHFYEMTLEMEILAFLYNFGFIGFILYFVPFFSILIYGVYILFKEFKKIDIEFIMTLEGLGLAIVIAFLAGYTFFNSSTMVVIVALCTIIIKKIRNINIDKTDSITTNYIIKNIRKEKALWTK